MTTHLEQRLHLGFLFIVINMHRGDDCARSRRNENFMCLSHASWTSTGVSLRRLDVVREERAVSEASPSLHGSRTLAPGDTFRKPSSACTVSRRSDALGITRQMHHVILLFGDFQRPCTVCTLSLCNCHLRVQRISAMHLMYTLDESGNRVYTLKVGTQFSLLQTEG